MGSYILDYAEIFTLVQDRDTDQDSIVPDPFRRTSSGPGAVWCE